MTTSSRANKPVSVEHAVATPALPATLSERYSLVRSRIAKAAAKSGRTERDVLLVAVCKFAEPDQIRELIRLGQIDFGENRVQQLTQRAAMFDEWLARFRTLPGAAAHQRGTPGTPAATDYFGAPRSPVGVLPPALRWHMIGHLQRNKARKVADVCRLIHSVDSLRLIEELQAIALKRESPIEVLLEVNVSGETSKHGCAIPAAIHLAEQIDSMINFKVRGLMTMAPLTPNSEEVRPVFSRLRELFQEIRKEGVGGPDFNILSMGMTNDFEIAIEEGANMVRIGTAIFGPPANPVQEADDDE